MYTIKHGDKTIATLDIPNATDYSINIPVEDCTLHVINDNANYPEDPFIIYMD